MIKDKITNSQMGSLLFSIMIGVGILSLPQAVASKAGVDGWIAILLGGLLAAGSTLLMAKLGVRFPEKSLIEYGPQLIGKIPGKLLCILFILYFLAFVSIVVRVSADVTKLFLLDNTPVEVIILSTFLTSIYVIQHGINPIARFNQFVQPIAAMLLIAVLFLTYSDSDLGNNLPVLGEGIEPVLRSLPTTFFSFLGFEMILFLLPFMKYPKQAAGTIIAAFSAVIFIYVFIMITCVSVLGAKEVAYVNYPTLAIAKNIELPGAFVERLESIMMLSWIPFALTTMVLYHYGASFVTAKLLGLQEHRVISLLFIPFVFLLSVLPRNVLQVDMWSQIVGMSGMLLNIVSLIGLWLGYAWNKRRRRL
ncbi:spore germination protein [Paenibacillus doosanensis]|uniref:GerAB/ArcD/ProY family transporter n=1 Tax=Paenibacillus doosanensis TaxID=1229154 RepID=UPI0021806FB9|nr:spore germination protein [Paenibacillus doosanensis]MCS7461560.1 spore germination protein [Paenibacillus doosanensis]